MRYFGRLKNKLLLFGGLTVLLFGGLLPLLAQYTYATGVLEPRSIQMSSSVAGQTAVSYTIRFQTATAGAIEGVVVDFCDNTPLIGVACTYTSGQSISLAGVALSSTTGGTGWITTVGNWTLGLSSPLLTITDAGNSTSQPINTTVTFVLTGFTNPNYTPTCIGGGTPPNCSFYARILTYTTPGGATGYTPTSTGAPTDQGGIALSTNQAITVTSKVQEQLIFCVYTGASCSAGGSAVSLGDTNDILYTTGPFVDKHTTYSVTTNAANGAIVRLLGSQLSGSAGTITAMGATPIIDTPGSNQFGMCSWSTGTVTVYPADGTHAYTNCTTALVTQSAGTTTTGGDDADSTTWAFDASGTTGSTSTYGWELSTVSAGTGTATVAFVGNVSVSQQAGVFTTTLKFVATGAY
jgi:hypothetical protein